MASLELDVAPGPLLVVGGTGRTGRLVVRLAADAGTAVRVLSRRAGDRVAGLPHGVSVHRGDITDARSVADAADGAAAVVVVVESADSDEVPNGARGVHYDGMRHVITATAPDTSVLLVSQIYITRPEAYPAVRNTIRWRAAAEEELRGSGRPYVILRPGWLTDDPAGTRALRLEQGDTGDGEVSRDDVAVCAVTALADRRVRGVTFELYNDAAGRQETLTDALSQLMPDATRTRGRS